MSQHDSRSPVPAAARSEELRFACLGSLRDNWDGYGSAAPNQTAMQWAVQIVLPRICEAVSVESRSWATPHITASESGEIVFEWWHGTRKITLYIWEGRVEYIKVGGVDIDNEMESGLLHSERDFIPLWSWLYG